MYQTEPHAITSRLLAVIEEFSGRRTPVTDPYLEEFMAMAGQDLLPHQEAVISAAAVLAARTPKS